MKRMKFTDFVKRFEPIRNPSVEAGNLYLWELATCENNSLHAPDIAKHGYVWTMTTCDETFDIYHCGYAPGKREGFIFTVRPWDIGDKALLIY